MHFGPSEEFEVVYLENNKEKTARLKAVTEKTIKAYVEANKPVSQKPFRLVMYDSRTAVMTIERFWDNKKEQNYKNFLKESFRQLKKQGVQNLVLDVRSNEGGNENYGVLLYSYLSRKPFRYYDHIKVARKEKPSFNAWTPKIYTKVIRKFMLKKTDKGYVFTFSKGLKTTKPKKNAYDGELYILINGSSFSVTTEFSARVHADGRATFIGQETGGGYRTNSSGMFTIVQLPHSKIDLGIPMFGFHMADIPPHITEGQGIQPDTVIVPGVQDILQQKDPVLEYTLQLIQENSSAAKQAAGVSPKK
jgi:C-terminal processing protease CtpA/Prc